MLCEDVGVRLFGRKGKLEKMEKKERRLKSEMGKAKNSEKNIYK